MCSTGYYTDASRLYEAADGRRWLVPMVRKAAMVAPLAAQFSLPHGWGLGGAITEGDFTGEEAQITYADLARQPVIQTGVHPSPLQTGAWEAAIPRGVPSAELLEHVLDLEGGFSAVWEKRFQSTTRTAIRKAEHSNLVVKAENSGELNRIFYEMFMDWSIRRGRERHLPAWLARLTNQRRDPLERFDRISKHLGQAYRVFVAFREGTPVAAAIYLTFGENAFYYRGTSRRELAHPVRANDLLQCLMIQAASDAGCRYYHMGESGGVGSLMRFKAGFGAVPTPFREYSIERLPITRAQAQKERLIKTMETLLLSRNNND